MSISFKDIERRFNERAALRRQGKVLLEDALYELQKEFGALPTDVEERLAAATKARAVAIRWDSEKWLVRNWPRVVAQLELQVMRYERVAAAGQQDVHTAHPLALIPTLFVHPDDTSDDGTVEVHEMPPRLRSDGRLVIDIRIPEKACPSQTAELIVLTTPDGTVVGPPETCTVGQHQKLSIRVPDELRNSLQKLLQTAAGNVGNLDWTKLPFRFVVRCSQAPQEKVRAAS